ncbi:MAG: hypothetical protein NDF54_07355 [archaeon GB-1867-035]|nr:hypothetical protein [Candidatus Culexmicrobium profundum]
MPYLDLLSLKRQVRVLNEEGRPVSGFIVWEHPDKLRFEKGNLYIQEYEYQSGPIDKFFSAVRDAINKFVNSLKNAAGQVAAELRYIMEYEATLPNGEKRRRVIAEIYMKDDVASIEADEETLALMGFREGQVLFPWAIIGSIFAGFIGGFLLGVGISLAFIILGILIGGNLGNAFVMAGLGVLTFTVFTGYYKFISAPFFIASAYFLYRHFSGK